MKLSEFKKIMPHLPDDIEITVGEVPAPRKSTLVEEHWGNHDGRYNMKCTECNWVSGDIHPGRGEYAPEFCPKGCIK